MIHKKSDLTRIGILGGGQLARMLALACYRLGLRPFIFACHKNDCALQVCADFFISDGKLKGLKAFASKVDVLIIENEFLDLDKLKTAIGKTPIYPSIETLRLVQNKLEQKKNIQRVGLPTLEFVPVSSPQDLEKAVEVLGERLVLKQETFGYDGKGTFIFQQAPNGKAFFKKHPEFSGYAEPMVDFKKELAVVVARGSSVVNFPLIETHQSEGICRWTKAPAEVSENAEAKAVSVARHLIDSFEGHGIFGVEMFLLDNDEVVINEIAPRVHNSGHFTMNACAVDQFELHLRAVLGMKLPQSLEFGSGGAAMVNIIGEKNKTLKEIDLPSFKSSSEDSSLWIHWYGKVGSTLKRKLGHINCTASSAEEALQKAQSVRRRLLI